MTSTVISSVIRIWKYLCEDGSKLLSNTDFINNSTPDVQ